jgi:hypothetical protein
MTVGIGAIILAGITSMITDVFKAQRTIQSKDAHRELISGIRQLLTDPAICSTSFSGGDPAGTGFTRTQIVDTATPPNIKYQIGTNYLNNLVTLTGFEIKNFTADNVAVNPKLGKAELNLRMNKIGSTIGSVEMTTTIFLRTTLDAADKLNSCYALGIADSLWQISPTNMADIYYSSGNVGIGTSSPGTALHIHNATDKNLLFGLSSNIAGGMEIVSSNDAIDTPLPLELRGTPTIFSIGNLGEKMRLDASGNVGIGTANPSSTLHVVDNMNYYGITSQSSAAQGYAIHGVGPNGLSADAFLASAAGITTTNSATGSIAQLAYQGWGVYCQAGLCGGATGQWQVQSDRRLKHQIFTIDNALEKILKMRGVYYHWRNPETDLKEGQKVGFIAQEVEKVFPQAVNTVKMPSGDGANFPEGTKVLAYSDLVGPIVQAIKELHAKWLSDHEQIVQLKAENIILKKQNDEILRRLELLEQ